MSTSLAAPAAPFRSTPADHPASGVSSPTGPAARAMRTAERKGPLQILVARTASQRQDCLRVRSAVFGHPLAGLTGVPPGNTPALADPEALGDSQDEDAILILALQHGRPVGTVRVNCGDHSDSPYRDLFSLDDLEADFPDAIAIHSKLAVLPEARRGRTTLHLTLAAYAAALDAEARLSLLGCRPDLLGLYEKFGFRAYRAPVDVPGFGAIAPLALENLDAAHLRACRSPLLPVLETHVRSVAAAPSRD